MSKEYILYADESISNGKYYSNFYGGALIRSDHLRLCQEELFKIKKKLKIGAEIKWSKVSKSYLEKYKKFTNKILDLVAENKIKFRIMFMQNATVPVGLSADDKELEYYKLYYQFIKHAFGFQYIDSNEQIRLRIYLDKLPEMKERNKRFKSYISSLEKNPDFRRAGIKIPEDQIAEIDSKKHILLQSVDVILGAMAFRLNDKHKRKKPGSNRRGNRTIAKEKLYKFIRSKISEEIYKNINIGITTGIQGDITNRWKHPYRHWKFEPKNHKFDSSKTK